MTLLDREKDFDLSAGGTVLFKIFGLLFALVAGGIVSAIAWAGDDGEGMDDTTAFIILAGILLVSVLAAFYRYVLVISNRRRQVRKGFYLGAIPIYRSRLPYDLFDHLELSCTVTDSDKFEPQSERRITARETRWSIHLAGPRDKTYLYDCMTRESAEEMARTLSEYTGFPFIPPPG